MVYVPQPYTYKYTPGQQQQQNQQNQQNQQASSGSNQSQQQQSSYTPAPYTPAPYTPAPYTPSTYTPAPYTPASNAYVPSSYVPGQVTASVAPTTSTYAASAVSRPSAPSAPAPALPDFCHALDLPPPTPDQHQQQQQSQPLPSLSTATTYGSSSMNYNNTQRGKDNSGFGTTSQSSYVAPYAVAVPASSSINYGVTSSSINSSTYTGGPTHGLVSEGNPSICHKVDYEIKGQEMQLVEIELEPSGTVIAEAGAMMYMEEGIDFQTKFGDGSDPKPGFWNQLLQAGGRLLTGESLFVTHFSNIGSARARVAFAAPYPGTILPINMVNVQNTLICQKDAFLCAALGTKLTIHFNKKIGSGLFGGEGFILQKLQGDGMAFVHACGTIVKRELHGEKLRLDTGCLVAFTDGINFDVQFVPGLKSMIFGGEGLFLATLQGTGTVWLQSLPFSRLADRIIQSAPSAGGRRQDEGSALTGRIGDVIDGDGFGFVGGLGRF